MNRKIEQSSNQRISFQAQKVSYEEANGGDIIQITFDADGSTDSDESLLPTRPYLMISECHEVSRKVSIEWFDGTDFDGGSSVVEYSLSETVFELSLNNGVHFIITHACSQKKLENIKTVLLNLSSKRQVRTS